MEFKISEHIRIIPLDPRSVLVKTQSKKNVNGDRKWADDPPRYYDTLQGACQAIVRGMATRGAEYKTAAELLAQQNAVVDRLAALFAKTPDVPATEFFDKYGDKTKRAPVKKQDEGLAELW